MPAREIVILGLMGLGIWLSGAVTFRFGGPMLFETGPLVLVASAVGIAVSVCLLLSTTLGWRKLPPSNAVTVAAVMALPGLFGDVALIADFNRLTGMQPATVGPFAAVIVFGNAVLLAYAVVLARRATA